MMQRIGASKYLTWFGNVIGSINFVILVVSRNEEKKKRVFM
jgi:hypothetical protein